MIANSLPVSLSPSDVFGTELLKKSIDRHQQENGENSYVSNFTELLTFIDFPDAYKLLQTHSKYLPPEWGKEFRSLIPVLEKLTPVRNRVAHGRPLHFDDLSTCLDAIDRLQKGISGRWPSLEEVQQKIATNPGWVLEMNLPTPPKDNVSHNLPIPDFDETGFMGRIEHLRSLGNMLKGPYPVISIIGEGGLGKSALALKIAYDLLDEEGIVYDAIVWSSAKANTVTGQEIKKIEEAVTNSLGMFRNVSTDLLGTNHDDEDCVGEILSYLKEFKILLILDNLETIIDGVLVDFFDRLPAGSKILTTSRIGLGEFERRLNLTPMSNSEGSSLMRAVSKARGVSQLSESPQARLNAFSHKLKNNPGFIKWFVSCVQSGVRPEKAIQSTDIFLDFCLENVYGYLGQDSRKILDVMQVLSRPLSIPEISYISSLEPIRLQQAVHQLLQTNMLVMSSSGNEISSETRYGLAELSRAYLVKKHATKSKDYQVYKNKERDLGQMYGQITGGFSHDSSSVYRIAVRSRSDTVIASYLMEALTAQRSNNSDLAMQLVEKAKELSPGFYEVYRVEAWINAQRGSFLAAKNAYEAAYELAPENPSLLVWYSGFLQRCENDYEKALELLDNALRLAPADSHAKLERARVHLHMGDFKHARDDLKATQGSMKSSSKRMARIFWDLLLQVSSRQAEKFSQTSDYNGVLEAVEIYFRDFEEMPRDCLDFKQLKRIQSINTVLVVASRHLFDGELKSRAEELISRSITEIQYLGGRVRTDYDESQKPNGESYDGRVFSLREYYGFIRCDEFEENIYFNKSEFSFSDLQQLSDESMVKFHIGNNQTGICAVCCKLA